MEVENCKEKLRTYVQLYTLGKQQICWGLRFLTGRRATNSTIMQSETNKSGKVTPPPQKKKSSCATMFKQEVLGLNRLSHGGLHLFIKKGRRLLLMSFSTLQECCCCSMFAANAKQDG